MRKKRTKFVRQLITFTRLKFWFDGSVTFPPHGFNGVTLFHVYQSLNFNVHKPYMGIFSVGCCKFYLRDNG